MYGANEIAIDGNPQKDVRYIRITDIDDHGNLHNDDWKTAKKIDEKYMLEETIYCLLEVVLQLVKHLSTKENMEGQFLRGI